MVATLASRTLAAIGCKFADWLTLLRPSALVGDYGRTATSAASSGRRKHPATIIMGRLGLFWVTILATVISAILSMLVAWAFGFVIDVPNYRAHILLAFVIPFFVTPLFSYFTALSMRDLQRARSHSRDLAAQTELERTYLHSAVNNMPIGLVLFDAKKRLIVCNDQYRNMYGLPPEITQRGSHLREMLEYRLGTGSFGAGVHVSSPSRS